MNDAFALARPDVSSAFDPSWYWHGVNNLAQTCRRIPRQVEIDSPFLYRAVLFCQAYQGYHRPVMKPPELLKTWPDLYVATEIYKDGACQDTRWILESLILANETPDQIVARFPCKKPVLEAYERLFYDVRDLLPYREFILTKVLRPSLDGTIVGNLDAQYKMVAYLGGPDLLAKVMDITAELTAAQQDMLSRMFKKTVSKNAVFAGIGTRITPNNSVELQDLHARVLESEAKSVQPIGGSTTAEEYVVGLTKTVGAIVQDSMFIPELPDLPANGKYLEPSTSQKVAEATNKLIP